MIALLGRALFIKPERVVISMKGKKHWLWRAVDSKGNVLDVLVQSKRDTKAAKRLLRKLLKQQGRSPRVMITPFRDFALQNSIGQWIN